MVDIKDTGTTVTGQAQRAAWLSHSLPPVEPLSETVLSIPVPLPTPMRYTLVYALRSARGVVLLDTGTDSDAGLRALTDGLARWRLELRDVEGVVVTHAHTDHLGLARRVVEGSGAWLGMSRLEAESLPARHGTADDFGDALRRDLRRKGVADGDTEDMVPDAAHTAAMFALGQPDRLYDDGDRIAGVEGDLRAVLTPGHTPGHLCLYERRQRLAFTGDHVLPRITSNVAVQPRHGADPLGEYLASLRRVGELDATEVLPAHEYRFAGLAARVREVTAHHAERLEEILGILATADGEPMTTWEAACACTWSRTWDRPYGAAQRLAVGEIAAHLSYLERRHRVVRGQVGGVDRWTCQPGPL